MNKETKKVTITENLTSKAPQKGSSKNWVHFGKALASLVIWGLGQLLNRQYIKSLFFFVFFVGLVLTEVSTGNYSKVVNPYDYLSGTDFTDTFAENFYSRVYERDFVTGYSYTTIGGETVNFDDYIDTHSTNNQLTMDILRQFIAKDLVDNNPVRYVDLLEYQKASTTTKFNVREADLLVDNAEDAAIIGQPNELKHVVIARSLYHNADYSAFYERVNVQTSELINIADPSDVVNIKAGATFPAASVLVYDKDINTPTETDYFSLDQYKLNGKLKTNSTNTEVVVEILDGTNTIYINIFDNLLDPTLKLPSIANYKDLVLQTNSVFIRESVNKVYEFYNPEGTVRSVFIGYHSTPFSKAFATYLGSLYTSPGYNYKSVDMQRFLIRTYLEMHPDLKTQFEKDFSNFFYEKAGIFLKGFWGVITLGEHGPWSINEYQTLGKALDPTNQTGLIPSYEIFGHISTFVLLDGLVGVLLILFFLIFMVWSAIDAYRVSKQRAEGEKVATTREYFKSVYHEGFEYIVLSPAVFVITFISIMPILFGFLIAFTGIQGNESLTGNFSWVGFSNFINIFDLSSELGQVFGKAFWKVLSWTVVWAFFSTFTVFFGGFFQAVILNNEHIPFKKFWRTILILPWAVPALLSQMVFSVMFNENGFINQVLRNIGVYKYLFDWGWLGKTTAEALQLVGINRLFYLGSSNIQWFSNPVNSTFVRATVIIVNIWLGFPYFMALMSGIMTSIDKSLYEAAKIDGANKGQLFRFITLPLVMYSTAPILIMTFSGNFNNFGVIYFMTGGGPNAGEAARGFAGDTDLLITWLYRLTTGSIPKYNVASVLSVLIFLFVGSVTAWNLTRTRAFKED